MNKCKKHPKYKAKMRPKVICSDCIDMYKKKTGKDYLIFVRRKPVILEPLFVKGHKVPGIIVDDYIPTRICNVAGKIEEGYLASIKVVNGSMAIDLD
jgi:hypothetical protein